MATARRWQSPSSARLSTAGETVFRQGDPAPTCIWWENGRNKITTPARNGREAFVEIIGRGQVFGSEHSLFVEQ